MIDIGLEISTPLQWTDVLGILSEQIHNQTLQELGVSCSHIALEASVSGLWSKTKGWSHSPHEVHICMSEKVTPVKKKKKTTDS